MAVLEIDYHDCAEVASALRVVPATIRSWVHAGLFPKGSKIGKNRVWTASEIQAWIRDGGTEGARKRLVQSGQKRRMGRPRKFERIAA